MHLCIPLRVEYFWAYRALVNKSLFAVGHLAVPVEAHLGYLLLTLGTLNYPGQSRGPGDDRLLGFALSFVLLLRHGNVCRDVGCFSDAGTAKIEADSDDKGLEGSRWNEKENGI